MRDLLEKLQKINEMQDTPIITITKITDDDSGISGGDEFDFAIPCDGPYNEYIKDKEAAKRLADNLRSVADMVERQADEQSKETSEH